MGRMEPSWLCDLLDGLEGVDGSLYRAWMAEHHPLPREDAKSMPRLDHPRACGANVVESFGEFCGHGSSPRMRGKQYIVRNDTNKTRIIPAHAGQT